MKRLLLTRITRPLLASALAFAGALLMTQPAQAQVLYEDEFNFGTVATPVALDDRTPGGTLGGTDDWVAHSSWVADNASLFGMDGGTAAGLMFTPTTGNIYELKARMSNTTAAGAWLSLGFALNNAGDVATRTNAFSNSTNGNGIGTVILRETGAVAWFAGPNTGDKTLDATGLLPGGFTNGQFYEFKLVLNTTVNNAWTMDLFVDNAQLDINGATAGNTYTYGTNPSITRLLLSTSGTAHTDRRYDNMSLTIIPEPSAAMLLLGSFGFLTILRRRRMA